MTDRRTQLLEAAVRVIAQDGVRGLRVERLAAEASVSTGLIYYHFTNRAGILGAALDHVNRRAQGYTEAANNQAEGPRAQVEQMLLSELQDTDDVRRNSVAWGELRASAVFDPDLREQLLTNTEAWADDVSELIAEGQRLGEIEPDLDPGLAADLLTALVEGVSERWHSGSLTLDRAHEVLTHAIDRIVGEPRH